MNWTKVKEHAEWAGVVLMGSLALFGLLFIADTALHVAGYPEAAVECPCHYSQPVETKITPAVISTVEDTPVPADPKISIMGPPEAAPGELVELNALGDSRTWAWGGSHDSEILVPIVDYRNYEGGRVLTFSTANPGVYLFWLSADQDGAVLSSHKLTIRGAQPPVVVPPVSPPVVTPPVVTPDPTKRAIRATYVYEQRQGAVPHGVSVAIDKLNRAGVVANKIDQNAIAGKGQAPVQHAVALDEAQKAGLPCLVVEYSSGLPKVVKAPTTETQVLEAVK